jgi:hypothetical protein
MSIRYIIVFLITAVCSAGCAPIAQVRPDVAVTCRLAHRAFGPVRTITVLAESDLDTRNKDPNAYTLTAVIPGGRRLGATVRHVDIRMPRERFNVAVTLDGVPYLHLNHLDLDIYLEMTIDGQVYLLHCLRDLGSQFTSD